MAEDNDLSRTLDIDSIEEIGLATKDRLEESGFKSIKDLVVEDQWPFQKLPAWKWIRLYIFATRQELGSKS